MAATIIDLFKAERASGPFVDPAMAQVIEEEDSTVFEKIPAGLLAVDTTETRIKRGQSSTSGSRGNSDAAWKTVEPWENQSMKDWPDEDSELDPWKIESV